MLRVVTAVDVEKPDQFRPNVPRVTTERLMDGKREIIIEHGREEYRLRITGAGKLLLTK